MTFSILNHTDQQEKLNLIKFKDIVDSRTSWNKYHSSNPNPILMIQQKPEKIEERGRVGSRKGMGQQGYAANKISEWIEEVIGDNAESCDWCEID